MTLSAADVAHVAVLARLGLDGAERERIGSQLEVILEHIARLQQVDTSSVSETAQVGELVNVMRDDVDGESLPSAVALGGAAASDGGYFVVGAIQDNELDG
ncbi:MAG: Asp-tRNA(Asn)/Glu-tRNA(Gln) amidotransferase subunit GatC [Candidatus Dormibacteraeota bacterium]|nr:Asp-tRNA(Asn)/Glu-tRNA(Gln) amidotransferase subunit GatC [Candidatus Dormibacteraeota bacterium]MBV9525849.1 Asp-tRNA(Asn)/Glu-tRNA(Gln) amidotransferase subunit GatC [Candidatus Dormibacteraeota bacterium]